MLINWRKCPYGAQKVIAAKSALLIFLSSFLSLSDCPAPDWEFKLPKFPQLLKGKNGDKLLEVGRAPTAPGGLCQLPNTDYIISCHQFFNHQYRVMRKSGDNWTPFPNLEMNVPGKGAPIELDSVLGIANNGFIVWMLDNGRRGKAKLVAWDAKNEGKLHKVIHLSNSVTSTSILKNLVLDPNHPFIYISDPADGIDSAIIVVNLKTGLSRRVLQGHISARHDPKVGIVLDGKAVVAHRADGNLATPLSGVSPFALDKKGTWLYYGPRNGNTLYRIETDLLRRSNLNNEVLAEKTQPFCPKPVCDSIIIDSKNRIYFSDIGNSAVTYVSPEDDYKTIQALVKDPRMVWPGGLLFGTDGNLHFFCNQLNRAPIFNGGSNKTSSPYYLFKIKLPSKRFNPRDITGKIPLLKP